MKRLFNKLLHRGFLPLLAVFLCLIGGTGQVWASSKTYKSKLTATGTAGQGYVYVSKTESDASATFGNAGTSKAQSNSQSSSWGATTGSYYVWAFPARAYKFSGWTVTNVNKNYGTSGTNDNMQVSEAETEKAATAVAQWTALTPYTITYLVPENGSYSVQYSYVDNKSGNAGLQAYNPSYNMTSAGGNQAVTSYERDEITLSVVGGTFLGWYESNAAGDDVTLLSTDEDFVYANNTTGKKVTKSLYIKAKFKEPSLYQASVTIGGVTTNYKTWAEALAAANASSGNPTITLLDNVLDLTTSQSITKSMTLDLNDYSITGNVTKLININAAGITVTIRDNGENGKGTISMIGSGNANLYGVCITKGTLNFESGTIHAENTAAYASNNSERASGVYVASPYTFNMTGGKIEAVADYYAYGVNIASGSATAHGTANISGGVVEATANIYARGVTTTGDLNITGGEIIANTISSSTAYGVYMDGDNAAKTTVEGGTITATAFTTTAYGILLNKASNILNVTGGTILAKTLGTTSAYGIFHNAAATTTVSGGTITATPKTDTGYGIYSKGGTINVTGGTVFGNATGKTGVGIYANAGTVNVEGGVVKSAAPTSASYALQQASSAIFNVTGGKFYTTSAATLACATAATAANMKISGGFYNLSTNIASYIPSDFEIFTLTDGAEYNEGYRYVPAAERPMGVSVCKIIDGSNTIFFYSMENALTYANQNSTKTLKLIVLSNCSLSAGYYTIPANTTLVVPWSATQTKEIGTTPTRRGNEFITPSLYCRLTLEEGVNLDVFGTIEASCQMAIKGQINGNNGCPSGPYGHILMEENTHITLESGSKLIAWGYVTGKGTIDAKRGAYVYEGFQMKDFPGGTCASGMLSAKKAFPVTQYYIQNVEVATTYRPGSRLYCATGAYIASGTRAANDVAIISNNASLFLMDDEDMSEDTWVRKSYDATKDVQVYEINSSASIGNLNINVSGYEMKSQNFDLPITNNMLIKVLTGTMGITQNTIVLPGAEIEVMKEATVRINSGCSLYLIDQAEWANKHGVANGVFAHKIDYTPSWTTCPRNTGVNPPSAKINLHGTFDMSGVVYTSAGGANICSTNEDAGTIKLNTAAPTTTKTTYTKYSTSPDYESYVCNPAQIRNTDGSCASIAGAKSGSSYCFIDDQWRCLETKVPFVIDKTDQYNWVYYAKPADYVALQGGSTTADPTPDDKHLYHSADGERLLILMPDNFWWEVKQTEEDDAVYYCEKNDTYYTYDDTNNKWIVKTVKVTFTNYDGSTITYKNKAGNTVDAIFDIAFGSKPEYLIGYPKRDADNYYVYSFVGWLPEITNDTKVFENTTYVAQYERADKLYAITFKDGTKTLELDYYGWGSMPVCEKLPTKAGYILSWSPALGAVSGNQTYTAVWTEETVDPTTLSYTVTWKNYEGTTLETDTEVPYGVTPSYDGETPAKDAIKDIAFVHDGWTPDVVPVTGNVTYTAKFRETPALYTVTFLAQDGITVLDEQQIAYGEVPVCQNMPTQASNAEFYYVAKWNKQITAVTGNVTYTHDGFTAYKNTCRLTVAAGANGSVLMDGASDPLSAIYDYGTNVTISATADEHYHFVQWNDGNTENPRSVTVTETKSLTAQFAIDQVTITWLNYDDVTIATTSVDYGTMPAYSGATPNRPAGCGVFYTFNGWAPAFAAATIATSYTAQYNEVSNPSLKSYQVAFEANGGTGSMSNQSFTYGSAQTLKANTFAHDPYTITYVYANGDSNGSADATVSFNGWSDGENTYTDKQSVNNLTDECDGVVTLTAQWAVGSVTLPTPERAGYTFSGWYDGEVKIGDAGVNYVPTSNKTLTASWTINKYTITFANIDGNGGTSEVEYEYGATPSYDGTPSKAEDDGFTYTFNGWSPELVPVTEAVTYTAQYKSEVKSIVNTEIELPEETTTELTSMTITQSGSVSIPANSVLKVNTLTIQASEANSGELDIVAEAQVQDVTTILYEYYFPAPVKTDWWYAIAVPFNVNGLTAVDDKGRTLRLDYEYDIIYYDAARRAEKGADSQNWKYVADDKDKTLVPGRMYMVLLGSKYSTTYLRFTKSGGNLINTEINLAENASSNIADAGWNMIANPAIYAASMADLSDKVAGGKGQTYNSVTDAYEEITLSDAMNVGKTVVVQVGSDHNLTVEKENTKSAVHRRVAAAESGVYRLSLNATDNEVSSTITISASEDAQDKYTIGKDLSKAGISSKVAELWVNNYGTQLCINEAPLVNEAAVYPLGFFAPKAGEYVLSITDMPDDGSTLYLTYQGEVIANLSIMETYTLDLEKGNTSDYGLLMRISRVASSLEEALVSAKSETEKVMVNGKLYLIRDQKIYSADGQLVK